MCVRGCTTHFRTPYAPHCESDHYIACQCMRPCKKLQVSLCRSTLHSLLLKQRLNPIEVAEAEVRLPLALLSLPLPLLPKYQVAAITKHAFTTFRGGRHRQRDREGGREGEGGKLKEATLGAHSESCKIIGCRTTLPLNSYWRVDTGEGARRTADVPRRTRSTSWVCRIVLALLLLASL